MTNLLKYAIIHDVSNSIILYNLKEGFTIMNNNYFNNKQYLTSARTLPDGCALRFTFPNGYAASVARDSVSYGGSQGLWEVAVIHGKEFVYDTPITDDVLGWQTDDDVEQVLKRIRELPKRVN